MEDKAFCRRKKTPRRGQQEEGDRKGKPALIPQPAYLGTAADKRLFPEYYYLLCTGSSIQLSGRQCRPRSLKWQRRETAPAIKRGEWTGEILRLRSSASGVGLGFPTAVHFPVRVVLCACPGVSLERGGVVTGQEQTYS